MEREIRNLQPDSIRAAKDSRSVTGTGIVFNSISADLGGFREVILPEAIKGVLEVSDCLALINHDISKGVLARSDKGRGSLKLETTPQGVQYSFIAPKTSVGDELLEGILRNDIKASSFSFTLAPDGETWTKRSDGTRLRTITKFANIYDVSAVYHPAYQDTRIALRSLEKFEKTAPVKRDITANMTPRQMKLYNDFQTLKNKSQFADAKAEVKKYSYGKRKK